MKRFTDTEMVLRPWFRSLKPRLKCLWLFMLCRCDMAGFLDMDWELAAFAIGEKVGPDDLKSMNGNVVRMGETKLFIPGFIPFQYGELSDKSRVHAAVLKVLEEHGIAYPYSIQSLSKGSCYPNRQGEGEGQGEGLGVGAGGGDVPKPPPQKRFIPPSPVEVTAYSRQIGYPLDGQAWCDAYEQKGWMVGKNKMKDWHAAVRNWKASKYVIGNGKSSGPQHDRINGPASPPSTWQLKQQLDAQDEIWNRKTQNESWLQTDECKALRKSRNELKRQIAGLK